MLAGGVGGTNPGGWKDLFGFGPGDGAPPYSVPYLPGVGLGLRVRILLFKFVHKLINFIILAQMVHPLNLTQKT